jgi:hypothetical protein
MPPELTDEQQEQLFECFKRELGADLNVWKPVFVYWLTELVRWWNKTAPAMQKLVQEMLVKIVAGGVVAGLVRKALTKMIVAIIKRAFPALAEADIAFAAGLAIGLFVGGVAIGTALHALATCWGVQFPDDPLELG